MSWLPGCLDGVVASGRTGRCARDTFGVVAVADRPVLVTSAYPRDIPGVPRERNLSGVSFAVANATGIRGARARRRRRDRRSGLFTVLEKAALTPARRSASVLCAREVGTSAALCLAAATVTAQAPPDVETLLASVGERIADYYKRAQNVVCTEKTMVQPVGYDYAPRGFARVTDTSSASRPTPRRRAGGGRRSSASW